MVRVCVMYPSQEGGTFDFDYYRDSHMVLVRQHLEPHGLKKTGIDRGIAGGVGGDADGKAPFICIGSLYFDSAEQYTEAMASVGTVLRDDIPNFTNITPTRQISEVMD